jgi:5-deoxy-glucuronate isomerase
MEWVYRKGVLKEEPFELIIDSAQKKISGWEHTGLRIIEVNPSSPITIDALQTEHLIVPLSGIDFEVAVAGGVRKLNGRSKVFSGPTDVLYIPINTEFSISGNGRIAIAQAPAKNEKPIQYLTPQDYPVVLRGAGAETRQVHDFGGIAALNADRFIVVEVIVPAGNWSGIPPHKHDTYIPGKESNLEEIYYFEIETTKGEIQKSEQVPHGSFKGNSADSRPYDVVTEVKSGDTVLVPYGWHGPVAASPGYDMYFLNVMAGPDPVREWNVTDDPSYAWIRETWKHRETDPRLPYTE